VYILLPDKILVMMDRELKDDDISSTTANDDVYSTTTNAARMLDIPN